MPVTSDVGPSTPANPADRANPPTPATPANRATLGTAWQRDHRLLTVSLVATVTLVGSETLAVATVMPKVADELGRAGYGAAFSVFSLASIVGVLLAGPSSDRRGPMLPALVGLGLFAAGLAIGAFAPSMAVLVAGRALQGIGAGAIPAIGYTVIGRAYREDARPRMLALLSTAWVVPGVVGPGLAGVVADTIGWRWVFGGLLPLVAVAAVIAAFALRAVGPAEQPASGPGQVSRLVRDALAFSIGMGLVVTALSSGSVAVVAGGIVVGMTLAAWPARRLLPGGWWRAAVGGPGAMLARAMISFAFISLDAFIPYLLTEVRGTSVTFAALAVTTTALVWTVGSWVVDRTVARLGLRRLAMAGFVAVAVGLAGQSLLLVAGVPLLIGLGALALSALGMGLAFTPLATVVLNTAPAGGQGEVSSQLALFELLGFALGPGVVGALVAAGDRSGWPTDRPLAIGIVIAVAVACGGLAVTRRAIPEDVPPPAHG